VRIMTLGTALFTATALALSASAQTTPTAPAITRTIVAATKLPSVVETGSRARSRARRSRRSATPSSQQRQTMPRQRRAPCFLRRARSRSIPRAGRGCRWPPIGCSSRRAGGWSRLQDCGERAESSLHSRKKEVDPVEATQTVSIARRLARAKSAMPSALPLNLRQPSALSRSRSLPVPNCRDAPGHIRRLLAP
jgi:hypothetical protein